MLVTGVLCEDDHGDDSEPGGDCGGPYRLAEQQCGPDQCEHRLGELQLRHLGDPSLGQTR